jgi:hypothetical protein
MLFLLSFVRLCLFFSFVLGLPLVDRILGCARSYSIMVWRTSSNDRTTMAWTFLCH